MHHFTPESDIQTDLWDSKTWVKHQPWSRTCNQENEPNLWIRQILRAHLSDPDCLMYGNWCTLYDSSQENTWTKVFSTHTHTHTHTHTYTHTPVSLTDILCVEFLPACLRSELWEDRQLCKARWPFWSVIQAKVPVTTCSAASMTGGLPQHRLGPSSDLCGRKFELGRFTLGIQTAVWSACKLSWALAITLQHNCTLLHRQQIISTQSYIYIYIYMYIYIFFIYESDPNLFL